MAGAPAAVPSPPLGASPEKVNMTNCTPSDPPPPDTVGSLVVGPVSAQRWVVRWHGQYRDAHELAAHFPPDREAYLSVFSFPFSVYCPHYIRAGNTPRGYAGPAACPALLFDIDRA